MQGYFISTKAQEPGIPIKWNELDRRYSKISEAYNKAPFNGPNCWGVIFYTLGFVDELTYIDTPYMDSLLSSSHCKKPQFSGKYLPGLISNFRDDRGELIHSFLVGNDDLAWQKFNPSEYSLITKELPLQVSQWYQKYSYTKGYSVYESIHLCRPTSLDEFTRNILAKAQNLERKQSSRDLLAQDFIDLKRKIEKQQLSDWTTFLLRIIYVYLQKAEKRLSDHYQDEVRDFRHRIFVQLLERPNAIETIGIFAPDHLDDQDIPLILRTITEAKIHQISTENLLPIVQYFNYSKGKKSIDDRSDWQGFISKLNLLPKRIQVSLLAVIDQFFVANDENLNKCLICKWAMKAIPNLGESTPSLRAREFTLQLESEGLIKQVPPQWKGAPRLITMEHLLELDPGNQFPNSVLIVTPPGFLYEEITVSPK